MGSIEGLKFVLIEHKAVKAGLHYDLRLQRNAAVPLVEFYDSWVLPKGIKGKFPKLAIPTEIHSKKGGEFEGTISEGYGKGKLKIRDTGSMTYLKKTDNEISFSLKGKKINGDFALIKTKIGWLLIKKNKTK